MKGLFQTANDGVITLMRLVLGLVFFAHGATVTLGWFGGSRFMQSVHVFHTVMGIPTPLAVLAILAQFLGGLGLIVGFLARVAAFGIAVDMLVAIFMVHLKVGLFMNWYGTQKGEGYEYHLLAVALCILIMIKGAGAASIDRLLGQAV